MTAEICRAKLLGAIDKSVQRNKKKQNKTKQLKDAKLCLRKMSRSGIRDLLRT